MLTLEMMLQKLTDPNTFNKNAAEFLETKKQLINSLVADKDHQALNNLLKISREHIEYLKNEQEKIALNIANIKKMNEYLNSQK